ncbi:putative RING-box protein 1a-like [Capsicum annuum]|nr:putative RING-box protein 1a-like [Capsicum annuum]
MIRGGGGGEYLCMMVLAKKFGASIVTLEHQYYGKTSPFKSLTIGNLKYLSSKQALFDLTPFRNSYQYDLLVAEKLFAFFNTMKFTCLSEGKGYHFPPCHIVNICGFRVLIDCPLDLSALAVFSPLPTVISNLFDEKTSNDGGQCSSNSESVRQEVAESFDSKSLIQAEPWYKTVKSLQLWSVHSLDVVLISSPTGMLGLPFLTRNKDFRAKIYATEAASRLGELLMEDLVSMHMEFRQFYGPEEFGCPQWMAWEKLELLPMALKDIVLGSEGTELCGWMSIYSAADIKGCMEKVQSVKYAEEACYNGSLTIKALSSGMEIGACNWNILSPRGSISYLSGSVFASTTATGFDYKALKGSDILLYSDFTDCNDVDSEKNNFPLATGCSYSSDIGSCSETIIESWIDSSEYTREMETVSSICSCALETISDGGSVLIAIGRPGVMLQLLEDMSLSLDSSNLKNIGTLSPKERYQDCVKVPRLCSSVPFSCSLGVENADSAEKFHLEKHQVEYFAR